MRKNFAKWFVVMIAALFMLGSMPAYAAGSGRIVEFVLKDSQLTAFVKNAGEPVAVSAALGRTACDDVYYQTITDAGTKIYTLILIDNSLSIPENSRSAIRTELLEWIAARNGNDAFAVGTVSSQVSIVRDFTADYVQLKEAIETIQYKNQEVYLTDALYGYLVNDPFHVDDENIFYRILLISDGADNKSLGYTKDELLSLLKERSVPVYMMGVGGGTSANNETLENMFALARATGGETFLLRDLSNTASLVSVMENDRSNLVVTVGIPEAAQDGSLQTLTITLQDQDGGSMVVLQDGIRMPLAIAGSPQDGDSSERGEAMPGDKTPAEKEFSFLLIVGIVAAAVVVLVIILVVILSGRRKKTVHEATPQFAAMASAKQEQSSQEQIVRQEAIREAEGTQYLEKPDDGAGTVQLWGQDDICRITLTDIHSPEKYYQVSMESSLTIGASIGSDICLDYDRTVSRTHCEIVREGKALFLINHSQSNGTLLNGVRVTAKTPLVSGSTIKMGRVEMRIQIDY